MKQFGKDFLCSLGVGTVIAVQLVFVVQSYQDQNSQIAEQNAKTEADNQQQLNNYQKQVNGFEAAIDAQIAQLSSDRSLWESQLEKSDPTVTMSAQQIHDLTWSYSLPTVSAQVADQNNELAYKLIAEQSACTDMISQFLKDTVRVPQGITVKTYRQDMCYGS